MTASPPKAHLTALTNSGGVEEEGESFAVQFNPETLEIQTRNTLQEERGEKQTLTPVQVVGGAERSLSVQLIFDETLEGNDVRNRTAPIAAFMQAGDAILSGYGEDSSALAVKIPSIVLFEWGMIRFRGVIADFSETLEYFSPEGVPLRASVKLSMTEKDPGFAPPATSNANEGTGGESGGLNVPPETPMPAGKPAEKLAKDNGVENKRLPETDNLFEASLEFDGATGTIRGALGKPSGGLGNGVGGGFGGGASFGLPAASIATGQIGISASASAGVGVGLDFGGGVSLRGGPDINLGASAETGLGLDAFSGLNTDVSGAGLGVSLGGGNGGGMGGGSGFSASAKIGGKTLFSAKADLGKSVDLNALLFGDDTV